MLMARAALVTSTIFAWVALACSSAQAQTSTPQVIKVHGFLSDSTGGSSVPADGTYAMTFTLYDAELGGLPVATAGPLSVSVTAGVYSVDLPFSAPEFSAAERWIEIRVGGEILSPRLRVVSGPFAYVAEKLDGMDASEFVLKAGDTMTGGLTVAGTVHSSEGGFQFPDGTTQTTASTPGGQGNTLDQAYDQGGPGAGRTITADAGAVNITGTGGLTVTGSVGIGTSTPTGSLEISSADSTPIKVTTSDAVARFVLEGSAGSLMRASDTSTAKYLSLQATSSGNTGAFVHLEGKDANVCCATGSGILLLESARQSPTGDIVFRTQGIDRAIINEVGNVGIGTTNPGSGPGYRLWVEASNNTTHAAVFRNGGGDGPGVLIEGGDGSGDYSLLWVGDYAGQIPRFVVKGDGRVGINTGSPSAALDVSGTTRTTVLEITSARDEKEQFAPVDTELLLEKVAALPLTTWAYKDAPSTRHIGPVAEDFYGAFAVGNSPKHIATVDADGIALAAIQGLYDVVQAKESRIANLEAAVTRKDGELSALRSRLEALERSLKIGIGTLSGTEPSSAGEAQ